MRVIAPILLLLYINFFHPVHLTVTNVEYDRSERAFLVKVRFFVDDFTRIIYIKYGVKPDFCQSSSLATEMIKRYLSQNLQLRVDGKQVQVSRYRIKKYYCQDVVLWVEVKIPYRGGFKRLEIYNSLMLDLYSDQRNMLIFTYGSLQKAFTFDKRHTTESIIIRS